MREVLDVIVTSSCRPAIVKAINGFLLKVHYTGKFHFIVHIDVVKKENLGFIERYLKNLKDYRNKGNEIDIFVNMNPDKVWYQAQARALNYLFAKVETPLYFHLEDDSVFLKKIDLDPLIKLMEKHYEIDHIRFNKETTKEKSWLYYLSDEISEEFLAPNVQEVIEDIPLVRAPVPAFNPYLGRSSLLKNFTNMPTDQPPEIYFCHQYSKMSNRGNIYIYGKINEGAYTRDIGRHPLRQMLKKFKYILSGGKYAKYLFWE